ncbi:MAG: DMT family transporter [Rhizobiaceae bacterium]
MNTHLKGLVITALGVLFVVPDSLFVRLIEADPLVVTFWRGITSGLLVLAAVVLVPSLGRLPAIFRTGWTGVVYIALMGSTGPGFVMAVTNTSVANVVFIFASIPMFAAIFSRIFLGEPITRRIVITMIAVAAGLAIIAYGSGANEIASWKGDVWALYVSMAYAGALTAVRPLREISMVPAIPIAYIASALVVWPFIEPMAAFPAQWTLFLGHGAFIGIATCFLTLGPRYISSTEVSLLILLESVLAPMLVWLVVGENPGRWALVGGAVVLSALVISNLWVLRRQ